MLLLVQEVLIRSFFFFSKLSAFIRKFNFLFVVVFPCLERNPKLYFPLFIKTTVKALD